MSDRTDQAPLRFMKMHGAGNDFVVIDAREGAAELSPALVRAVGDRNRGIGFDQLAVIETATDADLRLVFWNNDGSLAGACGNATRCVAAWEMARTGATSLGIRTERGMLAARLLDGRVWVNMGAPMLAWHEVPLAEDVNTDRLPLPGDPVATGMGNPHCTFFVDDIEGADLAAYGAFETHPLFPERTNVQIAQVTGPDTLRVRIWERGAGPTLASGSSACAVGSAAFRRGLTGRRVVLDMDGGQLEVDWREDGIWMTGPTAHVFDGVLTPAWIGAL